MRHFSPNDFMLDLHPITINLVGAGGTGSQMLTALGRIHHALVKLGRKGLHIEVYDNDKITESNIGRQMFSPSDIGRYKAQILVDRWNRFYGTEFEWSKSKFPVKSRDTSNIVVSCVDNVESRRKILEHYSDRAKKEKVSFRIPWYWMDFGNSQHSGQVVLGTFRDVPQPKDTPNTVNKLSTVFDVFPDMEKHDVDSGPSCSLAEALNEQDLFVNTSLIPFGSNILWELLKNYNIYYQGVFVNLNTYTVLPMEIA